MTLLFSRFLAYLIDKLLTVLFYGSVALLIKLYSRAADFLTAVPMFGLWFFLSLIFSQWLYTAFLESSSWRATVGKKLLKLEVSSLEGSKLSLFKASVRYFARFFLYPLFFLGFFLTPRSKKTLHDLLSRSKVGKARFEMVKQESSQGSSR